ncbi:bacteriohemerythrin [Endothiovibrio diazotrophicus]
MKKSYTLRAEAHFESGEVDAQHRQLTKAMSDLRRRIDRYDDARAAEELEEFIQYLNSYFLYHTFTEEKLMFDNQYPGDAYFEHQREHKSIVLDLLKLMEGETPRNHLRITATAPKERARQLIDGFEQWLHRHIEDLDRKLLEFLRTKGA